MARATCIWLVMDSEDNPVPVAAFTVKHELVSWLGEMDRRSAIRGILRVFRIPDGYNPRNRGIEMLTPADLIG